MAPLTTHHSRRNWIRLVWVVLVSACLVSRASASEWEVVKYQDREYVTADSVNEFYRFERFLTEGKDLIFKTQTVLMRWKVGAQEIYINNVKFNLSFPILEQKGKVLISGLDLTKLIDPVLRPNYIRRPQKFNTVIIDPGHGAHDPGAKGIYGYEKDYVLDTSLRLKKELEKRGLKVVMTRMTDTFLTLSQRVAFANKVDNAIFISIHYNSGNSSASGIETYSLAPQGTSSTNGGRASGSYFTGNGRDAENIALATAVHAMVMHRVDAVDRGIKRARYNVLCGIDKPAILFEGGFVTNSSEGKKINTPAYRDTLAQSIADAIVKFQKAVTTH